MAKTDLLYSVRTWQGPRRGNALRSVVRLLLLLSLVTPLTVEAQDIRTQEIHFDDNAATTATRNTLTVRGPLDDSLTLDYTLLLPSQTDFGPGSLLFVDSYTAGIGATRWLAATPSSVLTTDAAGNLVWGSVTLFLTAPGEWSDADSIGMGDFIYATQALNTGSPDTVVVTDDGELGVGTSSPDAWITVQGAGDLFRAKDNGGALRTVLTDEGEQNWFLGNPAGDFGQVRIGMTLSSPSMSLFRPGSADQFSIINRSTYTGIGYNADGSDTGGVFSIAQGGNVGIGLAAPQNRLHVTATTDPVRVEGLTSDTSLTTVLVIDANGVFHQRPAPTIFVEQPAWLLEGNAGTDASIDFLGTTDSIDLVMRTDNAERMRLNAIGDFGIGTASPGNRLHVSATTDPVRVEGLASDTTLTTVLVVDANGVFHQRPAPTIFVEQPAWLLEGNTGTDPSINFLGTTDNQNLVIRASNDTVMRFEPNATSPLIVGGFADNRAVGPGQVIAGGGRQSEPNTIASGSYNAISGGAAQSIEADVTGGGIGGGLTNTIRSDADFSTIAGGENNEIDSSSNGAVIGGGRNNVAQGSGATIGGGDDNRSTGVASTVVGGAENVLVGEHSTIAGGRGLNLRGNSSFGFLGNTAGANDMTVSENNVAVLGNVDLWLANNDTVASTIRLYEGNASTGTFPGTANFSSFEARSQSANIEYILPDTAGVFGDVLMIDAVSGSQVTLDWRRVASGPGAGWLLAGNIGTTAGTNFLGTIDNQPLELKVNNVRTMRYEPSAISPNIVGGYFENSVSAGEDGNVIAGGGSLGRTNTIGTGVDFGVIGGGRENELLDGSDFSLILGGEENVIDQESDYSAILSGGDNLINGISEYAVILGGEDNVIESAATYSTILGGSDNRVNGAYSTVLGGARLELGNNSVGFNAATNVSASTNLTAFDSVAYIGNANLWIGNTSGTASSVRFYEPNAITNYSGTNFTSLRSQAQAQNIEYVFPDTSGIVGDVLAVRTVIGAQVTLDWQNRNEGDGVGRLLFARKTANETVTAAAIPAVQNDDDLVLALAANRTYEISGALYMKRTSGVGSFDIAFDVPTGSVMLISFFANESKNGNSNTGADIRDIDAVGALANTGYKLVGLNTNWNVLHYKGLVVTGTTSGDIQVMWSPDGGTATVYTNSYIGAKVAEN